MSPDPEGCQLSKMFERRMSTCGEETKVLGIVKAFILREIEHVNCWNIASEIFRNAICVWYKCWTHDDFLI